MHDTNRPTGRKSPIILRNSLAEWITAAALCAACFFFMWAYHDWWRAKPYSLLTANECFALAGLFGVSLSLALGPLRRMTDRLRVCEGKGTGSEPADGSAAEAACSEVPVPFLSRALAGAFRLRRPLGIVAAVFAAAHVVSALLLLPEKYNWDYYMQEWLLLVLGIAVSLLLAAMAVSSTPGMLRRLGETKWRRLHGQGTLLLALILTHYLVLGKIGKWIEWFQLRDLPAPPGTLWLSLIGAAALAIRLIDLCFPRSA
jgi:hypothetical protein